MFTTTLQVLARTKLRKSTLGYTKGLLNRGLLVRDAETGRKSWISNYRFDVIDPIAGDYIRWDGRNVLCIVEGVVSDDEF